MTDDRSLPHALSLTERKKLTMTGALEVVSFDDTLVVLKTALGTLSVRGRDLQLKQLSPEGGSVEVGGEIGELSYEEPSREGGWFSRLLR